MHNLSGFAHMRRDMDGSFPWEKKGSIKTWGKFPCSVPMQPRCRIDLKDPQLLMPSALAKLHAHVARVWTYGGRFRVCPVKTSTVWRCGMLKFALLWSWWSGFPDLWTRVTTCDNTGYIYKNLPSYTRDGWEVPFVLTPIVMCCPIRGFWWQNWSNLSSRRSSRTLRTW